MGCGCSGTSGSCGCPECSSKKIIVPGAYSPSDLGGLERMPSITERGWTPGLSQGSSIGSITSPGYRPKRAWGANVPSLGSRRSAQRRKSRGIGRGEGGAAGEEGIVVGQIVPQQGGPGIQAIAQAPVWVTGAKFAGGQGAIQILKVCDCVGPGLCYFQGGCCPFVLGAYDSGIPPWISREEGCHVTATLSMDVDIAMPSRCEGAPSDDPFSRYSCPDALIGFVQLCRATFFELMIHKTNCTTTKCRTITSDDLHIDALSGQQGIETVLTPDWQIIRAGNWTTLQFGDSPSAPIGGHVDDTWIRVKKWGLYEFVTCVVAQCVECRDHIDLRGNVARKECTWYALGTWTWYLRVEAYIEETILEEYCELVRGNKIEVGGDPFSCNHWVLGENCKLRYTEFSPLPCVQLDQYLYESLGVKFSSELCFKPRYNEFMKEAEWHDVGPCKDNIEVIGPGPKLPIDDLPEGLVLNRALPLDVNVAQLGDVGLQIPPGVNKV